MKKKTRRYLRDNAALGPERLAAETGLPHDEVRAFFGQKPVSRASAGPSAAPARPSPVDFALIFLAAAAIRLAHLWAIRGTPLVTHTFVQDALYYVETASRILAGNFLDPGSTYGSPLYPFFLAPFLAAGEAAHAARGAQIVLDACTAGFVYLLSIRLFGRRAFAIAAGAAYAFYGLAIFYSAAILDTTLVTFLQVSFFLALLAAVEKRSPALWLAAGALAGAALLLKTNLLVFIPVLAAWSWRREGRAAALSLALFAAAVAAVLAPFAARNAAIEGRFSPFPVHGGLNFYVGNHEGATGVYTKIEGISDEPIRQIRDSVAKAGEEAGRELTPAEASSHWFRKGLAFAGRDPVAFGALGVKKLFLFWNRREVPSNTNYAFNRRFSEVLSLPLVPFGLVGGLALFGLAAAWRDADPRRRLLAYFVAAYAFSVALLFVTDRYRFPAVPFLIVLAADAARRCLEAVRDPDVTRRWTAAAALGLCVGLTLPDLGGKGSSDFAVEYNNRGNVYLDEGKFAEAVAEYKKAVEADPAYAVAYFNLGNALDASGDAAGAERAYRDALEKDPDYADARYNLGVLYKDRGEPERAAEEYRSVIASSPRYQKAYYALGNVHLEREEFVEAVRLYREALRLDPKHLKSLLNLGAALERQGDTAGAADAYLRAHAIDPENEKPLARLAVLGEKGEAS